MKLTPQLLPVQRDPSSAEAPDTEHASAAPFELPQDTWADDAHSGASDDRASDQHRAQEASQEHHSTASNPHESERAYEHASGDALDQHRALDAESDERDRRVSDAPLEANRSDAALDDERIGAKLADDQEREDGLAILARGFDKVRDIARRRLGQRATTSSGKGASAREASAQQGVTVQRDLGKIDTGRVEGAQLRPDAQHSDDQEASRGDTRIAGSKIEDMSREERSKRPASKRSSAATSDKLAQLRAVQRAGRVGRAERGRADIARDLLENVLDSRIDEARSADRIERQAARGEGVRAAVTENVAREVHKVFKKASDKRTETLENARRADIDGPNADADAEESAKFEMGSTSSGAQSITATPVTAATGVTAISGTASAGTQSMTMNQALDPEVAEALRNVRTEDPGDTVLKLRETDAGRLEVRIRANGADLVVLVKAEEQALRQKMVEGLPELRRALDRAELVAGRVDVAEFGAFENETRGDSDAGEFAGGSFEDNLERQASEDDDSASNGAKATNPQSASSARSTSNGTSRTEDGRLHVIV